MRLLFVVLLLAGCARIQGDQIQSARTNPNLVCQYGSVNISGQVLCCMNFAEAFKRNCSEKYAVQMPDGEVCVYKCEEVK